MRLLLAFATTMITCLALAIPARADLSYPDQRPVVNPLVDELRTLGETYWSRRGRDVPDADWFLAPDLGGRVIEHVEWNGVIGRYDVWLRDDILAFAQDERWEPRTHTGGDSFRELECRLVLHAQGHLLGLDDEYGTGRLMDTTGSYVPPICRNWRRALDRASQLAWHRREHPPVVAAWSASHVAFRLRRG